MTKNIPHYDKRYTKRFEDCFELDIDKDKFKRTNYPWDRLMLNNPWSVGYVTRLIEQRSFNRKEDWLGIIIIIRVNIE